MNVDQDPLTAILWLYLFMGTVERGPIRAHAQFPVSYRQRFSPALKSGRPEKQSDERGLPTVSLSDSPSLGLAPSGGCAVTLPSTLQARA